MPVIWDADTYEIVAGSTATIGVSVAIDGLVLTPKSFTWYLYDEDGEIVNERDGETETPSAKVYITLSGADLPNTGDNLIKQRLRVVTVCDHPSYGTDLTITDELTFYVTPLQTD